MFSSTIMVSDSEGLLGNDLQFQGLSGNDLLMQFAREIAKKQDPERVKLRLAEMLEREREPRCSRTEDMHVGSLSVRLTCARRGLHELRGLSTARGALEQCLRAHHRRLLVERRVRRLDRCVLVRLVEGERHVA